MQLRTAAALTMLLGLAALGASPAAAATGQCYDRYGRPAGPAFDTLYPNRRFIDAVIARGGNCIVTGDEGAPPPGAYGPGPGADGPYPPRGGHPNPGSPGSLPEGSHSTWCGSNPPSGYCIVPESR